MRAAILVAVAGALALGGCGDNLRGRDDAAPGTTSDAPPASADAATDAAVDAATVQPAGPCLDRSTDLPRPSTTLPCELLPPGFGS